MLLWQEDDEDDEPLDPNDFSTADLAEYCRQLFEHADTNGDGAIHQGHFGSADHHCTVVGQVCSSPMSSGSS